VIEVACQTYSLRAHPLRDMLLRVRKAGFRSVELWVGHADHRNGVGIASEVRRAAEEVGVSIDAYSVGGFVRVGTAVVAERLESAFAFAAALGVDLITGVIDRRAVPIVERLCARTGIRFALENHWYADFARVEGFVDVFRTTSPLVGVALDTGHLLAAGGRPADALPLLDGRLFDIHLKDVVVHGRLERWLFRRPRIEPRTVGSGDGDLDAFLAALVRGGYEGRIAIEDERPALPLSELQASLRAATDLLRAVTRPLAEAVS
jgi:sugar phosphate isomerase/epimerase